MEQYQINGIKAFQDMTEEEQKALLEKYLHEEEESGGCSGNCSGCNEVCGERQEGATDLTPRLAKKIYAVFSGKGGTGKSTVSCLLATALAAKGLKVGILDADLAGPSIAHFLGKSSSVVDSDESCVYTIKCDNGVEFISMANVEESPEKPILWYGKDLAIGALYFYREVKWGDLDVMLVDMPTGLGDVPMQIYTIIPFDGSICVAEPSQICDFVAQKSIQLSEMVYIHVLGVIENKITDFDDAKAHAEILGLPMVSAIPYDPMLGLDADFGKLAEHKRPELEQFVSTLYQQITG